MPVVPVELSKIVISETTGGPQVIVLREQKGTRLVPIWIGMPEALAIHRKIQGEAPPRPMTHDLLADVIERLGAKVTKVLIDEFVATPTGGTFHAKVVLQAEKEPILVDARPSDAVALAVRVGAPIFIEEKILKEEGQDPNQPTLEERNEESWEDGEGNGEDVQTEEEEEDENDNPEASDEENEEEKP